MNTTETYYTETVVMDIYKRIVNATEIYYTETVVQNGKKVLIIHYTDGTSKSVVKDLF